MLHAGETKSISFLQILQTFAAVFLVTAAGCAPTEHPSQSAALGALVATSQPAPVDLLVLGSGGPGAVGRASTCFGVEAIDPESLGLQFIAENQKSS